MVKEFAYEFWTIHTIYLHLHLNLHLFEMKKNHCHLCLYVYENFLWTVLTKNRRSLENEKSRKSIRNHFRTKSRKFKSRNKTWTKNSSRFEIRFRFLTITFYWFSFPVPVVFTDFWHQKPSDRKWPDLTENIANFRTVHCERLSSNIGQKQLFSNGKNFLTKSNLTLFKNSFDQNLPGLDS